ncbi:conserved hypothetical protein [Ixodes scapularis]|uniref:Protein cramped-like n=1 Tax=Ixodes scapularis TaxID=6945 RepID=B7P933_IXOSC|nr:conserved hypothetical protein [Ixodes scapularis]|eukprot:XP_002403574.1 conserved hypothetical protein [Ixodes scapularis]
MVKRRRLGSCSAQDEKRPEDISEVQREVAGEAPTPVRCSEVPTTTTATQQLTRTRSQNAPRVTSPCGVQGSDDGPEKLQQEAKNAMPAQRSSLRVLKRPRKDFGKDFESIQSYIAQRSKKKGVPAHCIKNKDQVRHFYYRTWHKISKVMNIGEGREDVKKQTQELYGLINYAELRKKYSASINEKNGQLLTELVLTGSTVVKIRGKRIRIKTPLCRALKKLNNVEDAKEEEPRKLPVEVCMEFRPRNNSAWVHVQSLAQNPRVRTKASLQRRLSNVLEHLQGRWRPIRARQKEQVLASLSTGGADSAAEPEPAWELRVWPVGPVSPVSITAVASSPNVSFECHRKKAVADGVKCRKTKQSKSAKQAATEVQQHDGNPSHVGNMSASADDNATDMKPLDPEREVTTAEDDAAKSLTLLRSMLEPDPVAEARERAKNGWTASEAGLMTVGELYLMMGCPTKIVLQYDFCPVEESKEAVTRQCTAMLKKLLSLATVMFAEKSKQKLLPGHRRGHRMRTTRKPLVVQRPLLPREQRRPVTLVQLLPSAPATIATMLPQPPPTMVEPLPATVKLLHPGPAFEVQTMPILEPTTVAVATQPVATEVNSAVMATQATSELAAQCTAQLNATSQQELSARVEELAAQTLEPSASSSALPSLSPPNISSLLDISLPESMPSDGGPTQLLTDGNALPSFADASGSSLSGLAASLETGSAMEGSNPLSSFVEASDSNLASAFGLACEEVRKASSREDEAKTEALTTPPMSPFKLVPSAPDPNWLNGESSDFSLSSLLNTLDSPLKGVQGSGLSTSGAPVLASDNSTLDSITRLVPDVDTQLQCLMNENSVDYVAKFADLAAQIASSNSESKS